jgi:16S rRNA (guanine527-N7)-methyltransferase
MDSSIIANYFPDLLSAQLEQFRQLGPLYSEWNEKINVISRKDIDELYERHVLHSLAIAKFTTFKPGTQLLDVGTGGGFPGIPLAIMFPEVHFHLVDSIGKKIKVVEEIARTIGLTNVTAEHNRMEKIKGPFDFIVSRAVAPTKQLYNWTHQSISKVSRNSLDNGWILLKGGDLKQELKEAKLPYQMTAISDYFSEAFFETKQVIYIPR